jgi:glutathione synthase/RimK-type ligase-like ATP-grasp enzyme
VTHEGLPHLDEDDRPLADALRRTGADVTPAIWSDARVDWPGFDLVVMRSCWDYDGRVTEFRAWLDALEAGGARVVNPVPALRWNLDKATFLADLRDRGVAIVPTVVVEPGTSRTLASLLEEAGWDEAVVKPSVSLDAHSTWRVRRSGAGPEADDRAGRPTDLETLFRSAMSAAPLLVQRYQPEIETDGEWSLVFLAGELAHTVRKVPPRGEFRVQSQYGGGKVREEASEELQADARRTIAAAEAACGESFTYARVDGVRTDEGFLLMELEVLDPSLYLDVAPRSVESARDVLRAAADSAR